MNPIVSFGNWECVTGCDCISIQNCKDELGTGEFIPKGGTEDNVATVRVVVNNGSTGRFFFTLYDVSTNLGYCNNRPSSPPLFGEDSDKAYDLEFDATQQGVVITNNNLKASTTSDNLSEFTIKIACNDYGPFSKLRVEFEPNSGSGCHIGYSDDGQCRPFITVPTDSDLDLIPDFVDQSAFAGEDEETSLSANKGDGFTAFEEYRGFILGTKHIRTSSSENDIFLHNKGVPISGGTAMFNDLKLDSKVRLVNDGDYQPLSNVINFNSVDGPDFHYYEQECIIMESQSLSSSNSWGINLDWASPWCPQKQNGIFIDSEAILYDGIELLEAVRPGDQWIYVIGSTSDLIRFTCFDGFLWGGQPNIVHQSGEFQINGDVISFIEVDLPNFRFKVNSSTISGSHPAESLIKYFPDHYATAAIDLVFSHEAGHAINFEHLAAKCTWDDIMHGGLQAGATPNTGLGRTNYTIPNKQKYRLVCH